MFNMFKKNRIKTIFQFLLFAFPLMSMGQTNITYEADLMRSHEINKNISVLVGNVVFNHEGTRLFCDSAYFFQIENKIEAFSKVRIKMSDTLNIYGDMLKYDGNTKIAEIYRNVKLIDNQTVLTTDYLNYDRKSGIASYNTGGKIIDKENVLTSKIGHYFTSKKQFFFKKDVLLTNPKYTIDSDTLMFNTVTEIAYFYGPTNIVSKENTIYCENGWYNTKTDKSQFSKNAWLETKTQHLDGDSLYYDRKIGFGKAFNNVTLIDTVKNITVKANYIENSELYHKSMATDSVLAIFVDNGDSLFLHADSLKAKYDTADNIELIIAFHKVKFFRSDIQGSCDSISFVMRDSLMTMYYTPVLWTDENQLTADTIMLLTGEKEMKEMFLRSNAYIISQSDSNQYNQVKGKNMQGFFSKNQLYKIKVKGNSETIYYMKEENSTELLGINKAVASDLLIFIINKQIETITFIKSPEGTLYPANELAEPDRLLKNFKWRDAQRPKQKMDVFIWE